MSFEYLCLPRLRLKGVVGGFPNYLNNSSNLSKLKGHETMVSVAYLRSGYGTVKQGYGRGYGTVKEGYGTWYSIVGHRYGTLEHGYCTVLHVYGILKHMYGTHMVHKGLVYLEI